MSRTEIKSMLEWKDIDWKTAEQNVFKLQKRIYNASKSGNVRLARKLQKLLVKSWSARLIAVRRVIQDNKGKNTAGVDGKKSLRPSERLKLAQKLKLSHKSTPTKRVWIPKSGRKEHRPLGIPTIEERAKQALLKQALEPEWEAKFEPNSYGFRPGRSTNDAISVIRKLIQFKPKFVLDADISRCFDKINHNKLLEKIDTFPSFRRQIKAWLKSGVINDGFPQETEAGTPQGGVISPLLANIALHGMEKILEEHFPGRKDGSIRNCERIYGDRVSVPRLIRYADDFVVINEKLAVVEECTEIIKRWLGDLGLELKPSKTRTVHTLERYKGQEPGFNFLGCNIRQYKEGKHTSKKIKSRFTEKLKTYSTIVKPSKESIKNHYDKIATVIHKHRANSQEVLIKELTPIIRGWCNYYTYQNSKEAFNKLDYLIYKRLWRWACRRSRMKKTAGWIADRYWLTIGKTKWNFAYKSKEGIIKLPHYRETQASKTYVKVKGDASPYNGDDNYWSKRLGDKYKTSDSQKARIIKRQEGKCTECGLTFKTRRYIGKTPH
ncbi:group II intron reverse transcriptase/maturase [Okeania sp. SIO1I7]|uniref:group II intron reverse transcriptase/maturase n=1 Tax=Okeania sp. SIO1I7 TaxID=2607772 RepID=UPI0025EE0D4D|nr:group II intron reverse transcriptase/maturase [Okeania sp. SIO1I7]